MHRQIVACTDSVHDFHSIFFILFLYGINTYQLVKFSEWFHRNSQPVKNFAGWNDIFKCNSKPSTWVTVCVCVCVWTISEEEWCVCWLLLRFVSFHPVGDDLAASPQSLKHWREWGWMALSLEGGDHHSLAFSPVFFGLHLGGCAFQFVSFAAVNCDPSSSLTLLLGAGWRKRRAHTKPRQSSRRRRSSTWRRRREMNMSSKSRCVSPEYSCFSAIIYQEINFWTHRKWIPLW